MGLTTIGLDIGSSAVRAVQLSHSSRGRATLERIGQVLLPAGAVIEGEVTDLEVVANAVRTLWSRYGFRGRQVAMGVANQQVVVRQLDVAYLPEPDFRQSLQFQVDDAIPIPIEHAVLDYHVLDEGDPADEERSTRILLVAAHKEMVDRFVEVASLAGLVPHSLDLDPFALLRALSVRASLLEERQAEAILDIGAGLTSVVVHEHGVPRFVRILPSGGSHLTASLADALGIEHAEAEALKVGPGPADSPDMDDDVAQHIEEHTARFADEIRGSLDFYAAQGGAAPVQSLVLSGGGALLRGLAGRLEEAVHLPVRRGHPLHELTMSRMLKLGPDELLDAEPHLAVAVGLALGAAE